MTWRNTRFVTQCIDSLSEIASAYDAVVFDQWGVLHNGTTPYANAVDCVAGLARAGQTLAVLSNSGKRRASNAARIAEMGFDTSLFAQIMTSGEALWSDVDAGKIPETKFFAIERSVGDACAWADGLPIELTDLDHAEAILLMGLPDGTRLVDLRAQLANALDADLPMYCSNPDCQSPRPDGLVISPGAVAFAYADMRGRVTFYGKPYRRIFDTLSAVLGAQRLLMVGDSLEHDILGAQFAGWDSLLVQGGLYANEFAHAGHDSVLANLVAQKGCSTPTYSIEVLA
jgi:HAD superfamily hydrolase (TIGR01459 family)